MRVERSFRGISLRLARHYLESVGGKVVDEQTAVGDGWKAELSEATVPVGQSLELTEVTVRFTGEKGILEDVIGRYEQKAVRAGG